MKTNKRIVFIIYILVILVNACIPSLHPLYTEKDLVLDNRIVGTWVSEESSEDESIWKIEKYKRESPGNIGGKRYNLEQIQYGDTINFEVYLLKLGDYFYIDFYPDEYQYDNFMREMHMFPVHTFARVNINKNSIVIEHFSILWIEGLIQENKIKISHEESGKNIILTASTQELQKFVVKYAEDENVYDGETTILKRKI